MRVDAFEPAGVPAVCRLPTSPASKDSGASSSDDGLRSWGSMACAYTRGSVGQHRDERMAFDRFTGSTNRRFYLRQDVPRSAVIGVLPSVSGMNEPKRVRVSLRRQALS